MTDGKAKATQKFTVGTEVFLAQDGSGPVSISSFRMGPGGVPQYRTSRNPKGPWLNEDEFILRPARRAAASSSSSSPAAPSAGVATPSPASVSPVDNEPPNKKRRLSETTKKSDHPTGSDAGTAASAGASPSPSSSQQSLSSSLSSQAAAGAAGTTSGMTILQQSPGERDPEDWVTDFVVGLPDRLQTVLIEDARALELGHQNARSSKLPTVKEMLDAYSRHMHRNAAETPLFNAEVPRLPPPQQQQPGATRHGTTASADHEEKVEDEASGEAACVVTVDADYYKDVVETLRVMFDCYICPCLLYASEQAAHKKAFPSTSRRKPSTAYSSVYFLRLVVALPVIAAVSDASLDKVARPIFLAHVRHLLEWLDTNHAKYFAAQH